MILQVLYQTFDSGRIFDRNLIVHEGLSNHNSHMLLCHSSSISRLHVSVGRPVLVRNEEGIPKDIFGKVQ